jgi:NADP-dependent alcohol dehydrogenase
MESFWFHNPTRIEFGRGTIARLGEHVPVDKRILLLYGGGSIKKNGVYDQVKKALGSRSVKEFAGIEPNPRYETCMKALTALRAVGCGFPSPQAAARWPAGDPWDILTKGAAVPSAMPWGGVLTLPATGSEMNANSVISRDSTREKLVQMGERVWDVHAGTTLEDYGIPAEACDIVGTRLEKRGGAKMGEKGVIGPREVREILRLRVGN